MGGDLCDVGLGTCQSSVNGKDSKPVESQLAAGSDGTVGDVFLVSRTTPRPQMLVDRDMHREPAVYVDPSRSPQIDRALVDRDLHGRTILFLGCSLDNGPVKHTCISSGAGGCANDTITDMAYMSCTCRLGEFRMANLLNFGTGEPPYWSCVHPKCTPRNHMPSAVHVRSEDHIKLDAVAFAARMLGTDSPTLVVVDSSLWDLANWWRGLGNL